MGKLKTAGRLWMKAGEKAASVLGIVIFAILFWIVFGPFALLGKLMKKQFLPRYEDGAKSWYFPYPSKEDSIKNLKRQW